LYVYFNDFYGCDYVAVNNFTDTYRVHHQDELYYIYIFKKTKSFKKLDFCRRFVDDMQKRNPELYINNDWFPSLINISSEQILSLVHYRGRVGKKVWDLHLI